MECYPNSSCFEEDKDKDGSNTKATTAATMSSRSKVRKWPLWRSSSMPEYSTNTEPMTPAVKASYFQLYRFATGFDMLAISISVIFAVVEGAIQPLMTVVLGNMAGQYRDAYHSPRSDSDFSNKTSKQTLYLVYMAIAEVLTTFVSLAGFRYVGERIAHEIRKRYLGALLRQEMAFFDHLDAGEATTRISADTTLIQDGISEKVGLTLANASAFVVAIIIAYIKHWKLASILTSTPICVLLVLKIGTYYIVKFGTVALDVSARAANLAEESFASMAVTVAFGSQAKLAKQYAAYLKTAQKLGFQHKTVSSLMVGVLSWVVMANFALAFWQSSRFVVIGVGGADLSNILTVCLALCLGLSRLVGIGPYIQNFTAATAASRSILATVNRRSPLDSSSAAGDTLGSVQGRLDFVNVRYAFPERPEFVVIDDISLSMPCGTSTALVGASGAGKSTLIALIERFYDPMAGSILLDGHDIRTLNIRFLREQIGLVSQEPMLFDTTISENIANGIPQSFEIMSMNERKTMIEEAAKIANAHLFITKFPAGYATQVGDRGFQLSGGQKQRIAIARAIISDPRILILDEATSALDSTSETIVQKALKKAFKGRTVIITAHRLSTVRNCDNIVVVGHGKIIEQGTHSELMHRKASYFKLVEAQQIPDSLERNDVVNIRKSEEILQELPFSHEHSINHEIKAFEANLPYYTAAPDSHIAVGSKPAVLFSWRLLASILARFTRQEWYFMLLGLICSIVTGGGNPAFAVLFAHCVSALSYSVAEYDLLRSDINFWSAMFIVLAFVQLVASTGQGLAFAISSERLLYRIRDCTFRTLLRQDISFFDEQQNAAGALTAFLSTEPSHVAALVNSALGTIFAVLTTLIAAVCLGLLYNARLAGVCIATIPIAVTCGMIRLVLAARLEQKMKAATQKSASHACEAIRAIRTVTSLNHQQDVWNKYRDHIEAQLRGSLGVNIRSSLLHAVLQALTLLSLAVVFWYGSTLFMEKEITQLQFFVCLMAILCGSISAGLMLSSCPDVGKALSAAWDIDALLSSRPALDPSSVEGRLLDGCRGDLELRNVTFSYPKRPGCPALKGIDMNVKSGQFVALVGPSGCGKSTILSLIARFYNPSSGSVRLDDHDVAELNIRDYRSHLAIVSQEPALYGGTIKDNILIGLDQAEGDSDLDDKITRVCIEANISDFISSLPDGMSTLVGSKGAQLSVGQKQRIAIARALVRNPKILLLDEATSALDGDSERVVQQALDKAAQGRTTIAIAHRVSACRNANSIIVLDAGQIVDQGTHEELMERGGFYYEQVVLQSSEL